MCQIHRQVTELDKCTDKWIFPGICWLVYREISSLHQQIYGDWTLCNTGRLVAIVTLIVNHESIGFSASSVNFILHKYTQNFTWTKKTFSNRDSQTMAMILFARFTACDFLRIVLPSCYRCTALHVYENPEIFFMTQVSHNSTLSPLCISKSG